MIPGAWWERGLARRCRVRLGFDSPGARFLLLQQEKAPAELTRLPIEGAAQPLLVHRSSSDERADSALADTCVSSLCRSGSGAYRDTRFHGGSDTLLPMGLASCAGAAVDRDSSPSRAVLRNHPGPVPLPRGVLSHPRLVSRICEGHH